MPTLRRKVCARRKRPDTARGLSGQDFDLVMRSPANPANLLRRSEAVPVQVGHAAIMARTAAATGSASITFTANVGTSDWEVQSS